MSVALQHHPRALTLCSLIAITLVWGCADLSTTPRRPKASKAVAVQPHNLAYPNGGWTCHSQDGMQTWTCTVDSSLTFADYFPGMDPTAVYEYLAPIDCSQDPSRCPSPHTSVSGGGYGISASSPTADDQTSLSIPICSPLPSNRDARAWCEGIIPIGYRLTRIQNALDAMRNIGGICSTLAAIGDSLIAHNTLRLFDRKGDPLLVQAGNAPLGGGASGPNSWMALSVNFTDLYYSADHATTGEPIRRDLQQLLAHELDHLNGADHIGSGTYITTNSQTCAGV